MPYKRRKGMTEKQIEKQIANTQAEIETACMGAGYTGQLVSDDKYADETGGVTSSPEFVYKYKVLREIIQLIFWLNRRIVALQNLRDPDRKVKAEARKSLASSDSEISLWRVNLGVRKNRRQSDSRK